MPSTYIGWFSFEDHRRGKSCGGTFSLVTQAPNFEAALRKLVVRLEERKFSNGKKPLFSKKAILSIRGFSEISEGMEEVPLIQYEEQDIDVASISCLCPDNKKTKGLEAYEAEKNKKESIYEIKKIDSSANWHLSYVDKDNKI